jgi:hypothetical protein
VPRRQLTIFTIGCWVAIITAAVHMAAHVSGPAEPANDTERRLMELATTHRMSMPGGSERSLMDFMDGFSLAFSVLLVLVGGVGLIVRQRCHKDGAAMMAVSRALAGGGLALVVISLSYWFIVPSMFLALMTFCFAFAAVRPPS